MKNGAIHTPALSCCVPNSLASPSMPEGNFGLAVHPPHAFSQPSSSCTLFPSKPSVLSRCAFASTDVSVMPSNSVFQLFHPTGTNGTSGGAVTAATARPHADMESVSDEPAVKKKSSELTPSALSGNESRPPPLRTRTFTPSPRQVSTFVFHVSAVSAPLTIAVPSRSAAAETHQDTRASVVRWLSLLPMSSTSGPGSAVRCTVA